MWRRDLPGLARGALTAIGVGTLFSLHLAWLWPSFAGEAPPEGGDASSLEVMTLNVLHGSGNAGEVVDLLDQAKPDVVVMQEVERGWWRQSVGAGLLARLPHVAGLPESGQPRTVVVARRPLGRARELSTVGDSLIVPVRMGGRTIDLLAVHPRYPVLADIWRADHQALAEVVDVERPAVIAGDFNATLDHAQMQRYRDLGYRSADELLNTGWQPTWPDHGAQSLGPVPLPRVVQIDHVLVSTRLTATAVAHLEVPRSDHRAVVARVAAR